MYQSQQLQLERVKTAATNVNISMKERAVGAVQDTMYDLQGNELGTRSYNEQTGKWTYQNPIVSKYVSPIFLYNY